MLKISQVTKLSVVLLALIASTNSWAQQIAMAITPSFTTTPAQFSCPGTATPLTFQLGGSVTNVPQTPATKIQLWIVPLPASTSLCPASPSAGFKFPSDYELTAPTSGAASVTLPTLNQTQFGAPTISTICSTITASPSSNLRWAVCPYVLDASVSPPTGALVRPLAPFLPPVVFIGTGGSGSTSQANSTISVSKKKAGDGQISFTVVTNFDETNGFNVCYFHGNLSASERDNLKSILQNDDNCTASSDTEADLPGSTTGSLTTEKGGTVDLTMYGLNNGEDYYFRVKGSSSQTWSSIEGPVRPLAAYSTLAAYNGPGGGASWQCAQSTGSTDASSLLSLFGVFALIFGLSPIRRRKMAKQLGMLSLVITIAFGAAPANARPGQLSLGLMGGPYKPNLDSYNTTAPNVKFPVYKCLFGDAWLPYVGAELDFLVSDPFGSIQMGFATAVSWGSGNALIRQPAIGETACPGNTDIKVGLTLIQFQPRVTYKFDAYLDEFPLVPYVRAGLIAEGYGFTYQGAPDTKGQRNTDPANPVGVRFGWDVAMGAMLLLDIIEPKVSAGARANGAYQHTYLRAEVAYMSINDFGSPGYDFSPVGLIGGKDVPLMYTLGLVVEFQ